MYLHCACPSPLSMLLVRVPWLPVYVLLAPPAGLRPACWHRLLASGLPAGIRPKKKLAYASFFP